MSENIINYKRALEVSVIADVGSEFSPAESAYLLRYIQGLEADLARRDEKIAELQFKLDSLCPCIDNPQDEHSLLVDAMCPIHGHPQQEIARREEKIEILEDALHKISNWCKAYPLEIADEPSAADWATAHAVMKEHGFSLSQFAMSSMRHVTTGVAKIADLEELE